MPGSGQTRVRHQDQPIGQPLIRPRKAPANKADRDQNTTSPPGGSKSSGNDRSTGRSSAGNGGRSSGGPEFVSPVDCDSQVSLLWMLTSLFIYMISNTYYLKI